VNVRSNKLRSGHTKSCGCRRKYNRPKWTLAEGEAAKNLLLHQYRSSAIKRGLLFELTREEFVNITSLDCYYCGDAPSKSVAMLHKGRSNKRSLNGDYIYNGIDRVDNNLGYTSLNCVACCWTCNELKKDKNKVDFLCHVEKIVKNMSNKE
jgi:hypothetical protein